jgi:ElaB/YqjD/DUF883 family membrane-anchored ribosome-binding protein
MPTESFDHAADELRKGARAAGDQGQAAVADALAAAERLINEAAAHAERILKDRLKRLRSQSDAYGDRAKSYTKDYTGKAVDQWEDAQSYILERVKDRPLTAALAGVGAGVLIGLLLANRPK